MLCISARAFIQGFLGVIVRLFRPSSDLRQNSNLQVNILTSKVYDILIQNSEIYVYIEINHVFHFQIYSTARIACNIIADSLVLHKLIDAVFLLKTFSTDQKEIITLK